MWRETLSAKFTYVEARRPLGRAPQARSFLRAKRAARDENMRAKRADFFTFFYIPLTHFKSVRRAFSELERDFSWKRDQNWLQIQLGLKKLVSAKWGIKNPERRARLWSSKDSNGRRYACWHKEFASSPPLFGRNRESHFELRPNRILSD